MITWFLLALGSAIANSCTQAMQKSAVSLGRYSKISISFIALATASLILFAISFLIIGAPEIDGRFWSAVLVTGIINIATFPLMLKAYELGEFSSVYSMILMTPAFLLITSFIFLGETTSWIGVLGVLLTVVGLWVITRGSHEHVAVPNFTKGNILAVSVAFLWSISVNFDKLATIHSDAFFAPATITALMAVGYLFYLLIKHRTVLVKNENQLDKAQHSWGLDLGLLLILGLAMAFSNVLHNAALLAGPASYTIAIKRLGILLGVFWGWLFFHEKDIAKKIVGAAIAIAGVVAILFA